MSAVTPRGLPEIRDDIAKIALVIAVYIMAILVGMLCALTLSKSIGLLLAAVLSVAGLYGLTRVFRGDAEERNAQRPWWRLTANPALGSVWVALFALQAAALWFSSDAWGGDLAWFAAAVYCVAAVGVLCSSVRLGKYRAA